MQLEYHTGSDGSKNRNNQPMRKSKKTIKKWQDACTVCLSGSKIFSKATAIVGTTADSVLMSLRRPGLLLRTPGHLRRRWNKIYVHPLLLNCPLTARWIHESEDHLHPLPLNCPLPARWIHESEQRPKIKCAMCKNGWIDWDAASETDSCGPKQLCIRLSPDTPMERVTWEDMCLRIVIKLPMHECIPHSANVPAQHVADKCIHHHDIYDGWQNGDAAFCHTALFNLIFSAVASSFLIGWILFQMANQLLKVICNDFFTKMIKSSFYLLTAI